MFTVRWHCPPTHAVSEYIECYINTVDPKPQEPANVTISDVTHNSATVCWSVFSIEYPPETYTVKYGTDRSNLDMESNVLQDQEPSNHQVQLSALQCNTTYYCSVMVHNGCGKEVETDPVTFNTLGLYSYSE